MSLITLKNIKKVYGKNQILFENLSLEIEKGEFVGLVGKSGSGKTTLLNIIGLITDISEGIITIDGQQKLSVNSRNAMLLRRYTIGYLFQNYGLIEDESVLWNLKLALEYKKMKKEDKLKVINEYLKQFNLSDMLNKKIYQLSGGEQQRIAIIKLILQGSQIILADEPTSGLDKENEQVVMKLLKELNEKGITIIMVTHNMDLRNYFSRVINVETFR
uniref:ABC transporter-related protein n=2 Tax=Enterococcus faecium TaxID=1352 RepID=E3USG0_ENTFC|nr:ABC transporter-related protein [Enterococcus faecium]